MSYELTGFRFEGKDDQGVDDPVFIRVFWGDSADIFVELRLGLLISMAVIENLINHFQTRQEVLLDGHSIDLLKKKSKCQTN